MMCLNPCFPKNWRLGPFVWKATAIQTRAQRIESKKFDIEYTSHLNLIVSHSYSDQLIAQ